MTTERTIGGYFELECGRHVPRHEGIYVNTGCNALRLVIRALKIKRIRAPYFTCPVVHKTLGSEGCEVLPYELDARLMPAKTFSKDDFVLANDYFGLTGGNVAELAAEYPNLIVDNAQSYYADPLGRATIYSPRKFFGLPDGGIAGFNRDEVADPFGSVGGGEQDVSYDRMSHLLKRHDLGASEAYADFKANDGALFDQPIRAMSRLTRALMGNVDDEFVRSRRLANFSYLFNQLRTDFPVNPLPESAPLVFPFVSHDATLRKRLIDARIFVATYWPGCERSDDLVNSILPLPIDQRYDSADMDRVMEVIRG